MNVLKAAAAVVLLGLLAACGEQTEQRPPVPPTTGATTSTVSGVPAQLAPIASAPCTALTDAQRAELGERGFTVRAGKVKAHAQVPTCDYGDLDHRETGSLWVTTYVVTDSGLAKLTADHQNGFAPDYWKPGKLADHDAIYYSGQGSPEFCGLAIGITDTSYVGIDVIKFNATARETGSCESTTAVAEQVLATVTGGR